MNITIAGASGLVGKALIEHLRKEGHTVDTLVRKKRCVDIFDWNPENFEIHPDVIKTSDCIINLCGSNIASSLWTKEKKNLIYKSRVDSTKTLANAIKIQEKRGLIFINASAIGIYQENLPVPLHEDAPLGDSFLATVCKDWEASAQKVVSNNTRVCCLRFSMILSENDGALAKMLLPFKIGFGAILGQGTQYMSWISIDDAVRAISFCISNQTLSGPINISSPTPLRNSEFSKILAKHFNKSVYFSVPAWVFSLLPGGMGRELFLNSYQVLPKKLEKEGFSFRHPTFQSFLENRIC